MVEALKNEKFDRDDQLKAELEEMLSTGKKFSLDKLISIQQHKLVDFLKKEKNIWAIHKFVGIDSM